MLWQNSLVMMDEQTGSLWSHLLGRCMQGELQDSQLTTLPSVLTDFASWKQLYPETSVMVWPQPPSVANRFQYDVTIYERTADTTNYVAGIVIGGTAKSYDFAVLEEQPLINDVVAKRPIAIWFNRDTGAVRCFDRSVENSVLDFQLKNGQVFDRASGSQWDLKRGIAIDGDLTGTRLRQRVITASIDRAWAFFYPDSEGWEAAEYPAASQR